AAAGRAAQAADRDRRPERLRGRRGAQARRPDALQREGRGALPPPSGRDAHAQSRAPRAPSRDAPVTPAGATPAFGSSPSWSGWTRAGARATPSPWRVDASLRSRPLGVSASVTLLSRAGRSWRAW